MTGDRWGIEIECGGVPREQVAQALADTLGSPARRGRGQGRNPTWTVAGWAVTYDPSLEPWPRDQRVEVSSPILERGAWPLGCVLEALRVVGAVTSDRCGVHVHVSTAGMDEHLLVRLVRVMHTFEAELLTGQPRRRRRFVKPTEPAVLTADAATLKQAWFGCEPERVRHYDRSRHHALNLQSFWYRGTVEFRHLPGTLDEARLRAWVGRVWTFVDAARADR